MNARPQRLTRGQGAADMPRRAARLMQVDIRHAYYADALSEGQCPDFGVCPTPPTAELMRSLGLMFLAEPAGFSVLYDVTRADGLCWYLRQHGTPPDGGPTGQYWTRLSFALSPTNPAFINFTDVPIGINPTAQNFYFSNQMAHRWGAEILLNEGERVDGAALLPVAGPEVRVETPPGVKAVTAFDIAGDPVMTVPRCVPVPGSPPSEVCRDFVFLDFKTLPEDKYTIECLAESGSPPISAQPMLYTLAAPIPLCFIDLLFSKPTADSAGIYPVDLFPVDGVPTVTPVRYALRFAARSTFWRYYIVPQPQREQLEDLAIETLGDAPPVVFTGPQKVRLVTGAPAYRFVSEARLLLQQQSPYRLRLKGWPKRAHGAEDVLMRRLPVAASRQVLPEGGRDAPDQNYSDIYVYV
jgi:hypothetical protein